MTPDNQPQGREWCSHIVFKKTNSQEKPHYYFDARAQYSLCPNLIIADHWDICPNCKTERPRPEEAKDELDEIFIQYGLSAYSKHDSLIKKDLRAWKEKDAMKLPDLSDILFKMQNTFPKNNITQTLKAGKEEKPKLWEILQQRFRKHYVAPQCNKDSECMMSNLSNAAKQYFLERLPKPKDQTSYYTAERHGNTHFNICLEQIRKVIEES